MASVVRYFIFYASADDSAERTYYDTAREARRALALLPKSLQREASVERAEF